MKLMKNDAMFVELDDIRYIGFVPTCVSNEMDECFETDEKIIQFSGKDAIAYWKGRRDILDYEQVRKMTDEEIQAKIDELNKYLKKECSKWLELLHDIMFQKFWEKDTDFKEKERTWSYMRETLEKYLKDREGYDRLFDKL